MSDASLPLAPTRSRQRRGAASKNKVWTELEDAKLIQIVNNHAMNSSPMTPINWFHVASFFPNKTQAQVSDRWLKVLDPNLLKGSWTREEDETIIAFVKANGKKHWSKLAGMLPGRLGKQVRERWVNHLDPSVNRGPWTPEEDETIIKLHQKYGNHWTFIGTHLTNRSDNAIKNRWNSTLSKRIDLQKKQAAQNNNNKQSQSSNQTSNIMSRSSSGVLSPQTNQPSPIPQQIPQVQQIQTLQQHPQQILSPQMPQSIVLPPLNSIILSPSNMSQNSLIQNSPTVQMIPNSPQLQFIPNSPPYQMFPNSFNLPTSSPAPTPTISPAKTKLPSISILGQSQSDSVHLVNASSLDSLNSPFLPPIPAQPVKQYNNQMGLMNLIIH